MSDEVPFLDLNGVEILNSARAAAYTLKYGDSGWNISGQGCSVMTREIGAPAGGVFVSPAADPAPWYDAAVAHSTDFLGFFVSSMDWMNALTSRAVTQRGGALGGSNLGPELLAGKAIKVAGALSAVNAGGLEYGRAWLQEKLSAASGCGLWTARLRDHCPPDNGLTDTDGEWILYDVGLAVGFETQNPNRCPYMEQFTFTLLAELPLKYARRAASLAKVTIPELPLLPASPRTAQQTGSTLATDSFTRGNTGPPPSASWSAPIISGGTSTLVVDTNSLKNTSATRSDAWWNANTFDRDMLNSIVVSTADNGGTAQLFLFSRLLNPNTAAASCVYAQVLMGAGVLQVQFFALTGGVGTVLSAARSIAWTIQANDVLSLVARGPALELWVIRPGSSTQRVGSTYDTTNGANVIGSNFFAGVGIAGSTTLRCINWVGRLIVSRLGIELPTLDPVTVDLGAPKIGRNALVLTLDNTAEAVGSVRGLKVMSKLLLPAAVQFTDAFGADDIATRYVKKVPAGAGPWLQVTGGKLKPLVASLGLPVHYVWSTDGTAPNIRTSRRFVARCTFTTGASVTNGIWALAFGVGSDSWLTAELVASASQLRLTRYTSMLVSGTVVVTTAITLATATNYLLVAEAEYQGRMSAWVVNATTGEMLAEVFTTAGMGDTIVGTPLFGGGIAVKPVGTDEAYDDFHIADVYPETNLMTVSQLPPSDIVELDSSRHKATWTDSNPHTGVTVLRDGVGVLEGPTLGWQETDGAQTTALLIPHQAGLPLLNPPQWTGETQASRR